VCIILAVLAAFKQQRWYQSAGFEPIPKIAPRDEAEDLNGDWDELMPAIGGHAVTSDREVAGSMSSLELEITNKLAGSGSSLELEITNKKLELHDRQLMEADMVGLQKMPEAVFETETALYDFSCGFGSEEAERWRL